VGLLRVVSEPDGATVYVNDEVRGQTPLAISLPRDTYAIRVVLAGHKPSSRTATLDVPEFTVSFPLEAEVVTGQVNVFGKDGSSVSVDGTSRGKVPVTIRLAEGVHEFTVATEDGQSCTVRKEVTFAGAGKPVTVSLSCP
jgi:hypothetical protein